MNQKKKIDYSKIYSPHKLSMFEQCPKEYHLTYLDPFYKKEKYNLQRQPENIWDFQTVGKAVHNAITLHYYLPEGERTKENLLEGLKQTWRSEIAWTMEPPLGKVGGFDSIEEERKAYREALEMLKNFFRISKTNPPIEYLPTKDFQKSIEDYKDLIIPLNGRFDLSGKFDLILGNEDDSLQIIDFKTGREGRGSDFQLRFYKVLAEENFGKPVTGGSFFYLKTGNREDFNLENEKSEKIKEEILEKIEKIEAAKNFKAQPGALCDFCLFRTICSERNGLDGTKENGDKSDSLNDLPF